MDLIFSNCLAFKFSINAPSTWLLVAFLRFYSPVHGSGYSCSIPASFLSGTSGFSESGGSLLLSFSQQALTIRPGHPPSRSDRLSVAARPAGRSKGACVTARGRDQLPWCPALPKRHIVEDALSTGVPGSDLTAICI